MFQDRVQDTWGRSFRQHEAKDWSLRIGRQVKVMCRHSSQGLLKRHSCCGNQCFVIRPEKVVTSAVAKLFGNLVRVGERDMCCCSPLCISSSCRRSRDRTPVRQPYGPRETEVCKEGFSSAKYFPPGPRGIECIAVRRRRKSWRLEQTGNGFRQGQSCDSDRACMASKTYGPKAAYLGASSGLPVSMST